MLNSEMIVVRLLKIGRDRAIRHWVVGLSFLLILMNGVNGINRSLINRRAGGALFGSESVPAALPSSSEVHKTLKSAGFDIIDRYWEPLEIKRYVPTLSGDRADMPHGIQNTPKYTVKCPGTYIDFRLCKYYDAMDAMDTLNALRNIARIQVPRAKVEYDLWDSNHHKIRMRILSRVINMIDCEILMIESSQFLKDKTQIDPAHLPDYTAEAQNTVRHAMYESVCCVTFSMYSYLSKLLPINSAFVLLRPIVKVTLTGIEFNNAPYLDRLTLVDNYTIAFKSLPRTVDINLSSLQKSTAKCGMIIFLDADPQVTLTGLDHAINQHPNLTINIPWTSLPHLIRFNVSYIRVHAISGLLINSDSIRKFYAFLQDLPTNPISTRIEVDEVVFKVPTYRACGPCEYSKGIYTPEVMVNYGIVTNAVKIHYNPGRTDLQATIALLHSINAVPESVLKEAKDEMIVCCGDKTNKPAWSLPQTVNIQFSCPKLKDLLDKYNGSNYYCFCQNLIYKTLNITGKQSPYKGQVYLCMLFLNNLGSIRGQKLCISKIRDGRRTTSKFDLVALQAKAAKFRRYTLDLDILILDKVDIAIIYRIFGCYDIVKLNEVHILNQAFKNLAIAQLLSQALGEKVTRLVLNDLTKLNEIKRYDQRDKIKGFSLFKYVKEYRKDNESVEGLHLDKLVLQLGCVDFSAQSRALSEIRDHGVQIPVLISFEEYLANTLTVAGDKLVQLYGITIEALKADINHCQTQDQSQNPTEAQTPVKNSYITELSLKFHEQHMLTESTLVDIITWMACRFENVAKLQLLNVKASKEERKLIVSRNYLFRDLPTLNSIQLSKGNSKNSFIELLSRSYRHVLMSEVPCPESITIVTLSTVLERLAENVDKLSELTNQHINPKATFHHIERELKTNNENKEHDEEDEEDDNMCDICCSYDPILTVRKPRSAWNGLLCIAKPQCPAESESSTVTTLCYFTCRHRQCNRCAFTNYSQMPKCPYCQRPIRIDNIYRLIRVPRSGIGFIASSAQASEAANNKWLESKVWVDDHVYLYVADRQTTDLLTIHERMPSYDESNPIHVI
ncbi:hypothetical protein NEHOM01_1549 [Nematocida homosporus]|uniref:uncharacterized protein n=1 Tax=Nematocida homosporus TaxID=1912981 RepID=UPI00222047D6|nr:uncharacterized protein NEHOM01_1549 [Nematocida homosporus]KAI5186563.1 hypothetical protein NEHOM01_1549 [Nematocida homosporus]